MQYDLSASVCDELGDFIFDILNRPSNRADSKAKISALINGETVDVCEFELPDDHHWEYLHIKVEKFALFNPKAELIISLVPQVKTDTDLEYEGTVRKVNNGFFTPD